jgi:hypothetical protein
MLLRSIRQGLFGWSGEAVKPAPPHLTADEVLRREAQAIHNVSLAGQVELYRSLNKLNATALCLSGAVSEAPLSDSGIIQVFGFSPAFGATRSGA